MTGLTTALIIKWIILFMVCVGVSMQIGTGFGRLLKLRTNCFESMSLGFVVVLAAIQLFGWLCVAYRWKMLFFAIYAIAVVIMLAIISKKYTNYRNIEWKFRNVHWISNFVTMVMIVLTILYYRSDADDAFYVSNATLFQNSICINAYDSSFGNKLLGTVPMYDFQIWEALLALIAKIFSVEAVTLMHTLCIPILLLFSASAYCFLGRVLLGDKLKSELFYLLLSVFHLFGGYAVYSEGSFLLSRIWQGKAVYLTIILPFMIAVMLQMLKEQFYLQASISICACMLAGMALNPTSLYVMGFQVLFMSIAIAISMHKVKPLLLCIPAVIVSGVFTLMIYLRASQFDGQIEAASNAGADFVKNTFINFMGDGKIYFILFAIALIVIFLWGNLAAKVYFILTPLLMFVGIWNPVMGRVVAEQLTKCPSYWRVFWLLPVGTALAYTIVSMLEKGNKLVKTVIVIVGLLVMALPGVWMFSTENGFIKSNNVEKVPNEVISFGEYLGGDEHKIILGCDAFASTIRQKYVNCELIYSRAQYVLDLFAYRGKEAEAEDRMNMAYFANGILDDISGVETLLKNYQVDYVVLRSDKERDIQYLESIQWRDVDRSDEYVLMAR